MRKTKAPKRSNTNSYSLPFCYTDNGRPASPSSGEQVCLRSIVCVANDSGLTSLWKFSDGAKKRSLPSSQARPSVPLKQLTCKYHTAQRSAVRILDTNVNLHGLRQQLPAVVVGVYAYTPTPVECKRVSLPWQEHVSYTWYSTEQQTLLIVDAQ